MPAPPPPPPPPLPTSAFFTVSPVNPPPAVISSGALSFKALLAQRLGAGRGEEELPADESATSSGRQEPRTPPALDIPPPPQAERQDDQDDQDDTLARRDADSQDDHDGTRARRAAEQPQVDEDADSKPEQQPDSTPKSGFQLPAVYVKHGQVHYYVNFLFGWQLRYAALSRPTGREPEFILSKTAEQLANDKAEARMPVGTVTALPTGTPGAFDVVSSAGRGGCCSLRAASDQESAAWRQAIDAARGHFLATRAAEAAALRQGQASGEGQGSAARDGHHRSPNEAASGESGGDNNEDSDDDWTVVRDINEMLSEAETAASGLQFSFVPCPGRSKGTFLITAVRVDHAQPDHDPEESTGGHENETHDAEAREADTGGLSERAPEQYTQQFTTPFFRQCLERLLDLRPMLRPKLPLLPKSRWFDRLGDSANLQPFATILDTAAAAVGITLVLDIFFDVSVGDAIRNALFTTTDAQWVRDVQMRLANAQAALEAHYQRRSGVDVMELVETARKLHAEEDALVAALAEALEQFYGQERESLAVHLTLAQERLSTLLLGGPTSAAHVLKVASRPVRRQPLKVLLECSGGGGIGSEDDRGGVGSPPPRVLPPPVATALEEACGDDATTDVCRRECHRWLQEACEDHVALRLLREQRTKRVFDIYDNALTVATDEWRQVSSVSFVSKPQLQRLGHRQRKLSTTSRNAELKWDQARAALLQDELLIAAAAVDACAAEYENAVRDYAHTSRPEVVAQLSRAMQSNEKLRSITSRLSSLQQSDCKAELDAARAVSEDFRRPPQERRKALARARKLEGRGAALRALQRGDEETLAVIEIRWARLQKEHSMHTEAAARHEARAQQAQQGMASSVAARRQAAARLQEQREAGAMHAEKFEAQLCERKKREEEIGVRSRRVAAQRAQAYKQGSQPQTPQPSGRASPHGHVEDADRRSQLAAAQRLAQQRIARYLVSQAARDEAARLEEAGAFEAERAEEVRRAANVQEATAQKHAEARQLIHCQKTPEERPLHQRRSWRVLPYTQQPAAQREVVNDDDSASDWDDSPDGGLVGDGGVSQQLSPFTQNVTVAKGARTDSGIPTPQLPTKQKSKSSAHVRGRQPARDATLPDDEDELSALAAGRRGLNRVEKAAASPSISGRLPQLKAAAVATPRKASKIPTPKSSRQTTSGRGDRSAKDGKDGETTERPTMMRPKTGPSPRGKEPGSPAERKATSPPPPPPAPSTVSLVLPPSPPPPPPVLPPSAFGPPPPPQAPAPNLVVSPSSQGASPGESRVSAATPARGNFLTEIRNFRSLVTLRDVEKEQPRGATAAGAAAPAASGNGSLQNSLEAAMALRRKAIESTLKDLRDDNEQWKSDGASSGSEADEDSDWDDAADEHEDSGPESA